MNREVAALEGSIDQVATDECTGFGVLETERGRLPLTALVVEAKIVGLIAETHVRQTFRNSLDQPLEATYIFPLPDRAAVTRFQMHVAGRTVEGELKERGQAREEYDVAIAQGHRAAIAEEDRSGVFSLRVGNIPPKEEATVELTLAGPLPVCDGEATFRFPLVVAPRYTPGIPLDGPSVGAGVTPDTDQVPDASRITPPVLLLGFPNPVALSLKVKLAPGGIAAKNEDWSGCIRSSLHSIITDDGPGWTIRLQPGERLNRDFILRFPAAQSTIATSLVYHPATTENAGTFALTLLPPAAVDGAKPLPRSVVFVLDRSGSMGGWKMVAARRALGRMVDTMLEQDEFTVLAFDDTVEFPPHARNGLVAGSDRERWRMLEWLGSVDARGGTEMGPALQAALELLPKPSGNQRSIVVLITDGQVTGEDSILRSLKRCTNNTLPRIFTVGIDQAVNAGFLQRLADLSQGSCEFIESEDRLDEVMDRIHRLIGAPVLTQLHLSPVDLALIEESISPLRIPDLHAGRPVTIYGRHRSTGDSIALRIEAEDAAGGQWDQVLVGQTAQGTVLKSLWGRSTVRDLEDEYAAGQSCDPKKLMEQIVAVSLESHVLSRFTAYVAVDKSDIVNPGGQPLEVIQPVESPQGWADAQRGMAWAYQRLQRLSAMPASASLHVDSLAARSFDDRMCLRSMDLEEPADICYALPGPCPPSERDAPGLTLDEHLAEWAAGDSQAMIRVLNLILEDAVQADATGLSVARLKRGVRVRFVVGRKNVDYAMLPAECWDALLAAAAAHTNVDIASPKSPLRWEFKLPLGPQEFTVVVTLHRTKSSETMTIEIAAGPQEATGNRAAKRSRFWT